MLSHPSIVVYHDTYAVEERDGKEEEAHCFPRSPVVVKRLGNRAFGCTRQRRPSVQTHLLPSYRLFAARSRVALRGAEHCSNLPYLQGRLLQKNC